MPNVFLSSSSTDAPPDGVPLADRLCDDVSAQRDWLLGLVSEPEKREVRRHALDAFELGATLYALLSEIDSPGATERYGFQLEAAACATRTPPLPDVPAYRVVEVLGRGGMGYVYQAHAPQTVKAMIGGSGEEVSLDRQRHVVHRDVKPSNIWLAEPTETRVVLLDFGVARITPPEADREAELAAAWEHLAGEAAADRFDRLRLAVAGLADRLHRDCPSAIDRVVLSDHPDLADVDDPDAGWRVCLGRYRWRRLLWFVRERCSADVPADRRWAVEGGFGRLSRAGTPEVYARLACWQAGGEPSAPQQGDRGTVGKANTTVSLVQACVQGERDQVVRALDRYPVHLAALRRGGLGEDRGGEMIDALIRDLQATPAEARMSFADHFPRWAEGYLARSGGSGAGEPLTWPSLLEYAVVIATLRVNEHDALPWQQRFKSAARAANIDQVDRLLRFEFPAGDSIPEAGPAYRAKLAELAAGELEACADEELMTA